jgi:hypothetical protein
MTASSCASSLADNQSVKAGLPVHPVTEAKGSAGIKSVHPRFCEVP